MYATRKTVEKKYCNTYNLMYQNTAIVVVNVCCDRDDLHNRFLKMSEMTYHKWNPSARATGITNTGQ